MEYKQNKTELGPNVLNFEHHGTLSAEETVRAVQSYNREYVDDFRDTPRRDSLIERGFLSEPSD